MQQISDSVSLLQNRHATSALNSRERESWEVEYIYICVCVCVCVGVGVCTEVSLLVV